MNIHDFFKLIQESIFIGLFQKNLYHAMYMYINTYRRSLKIIITV